MGVSEALSTELVFGLCAWVFVTKTKNPRPKTVRIISRNTSKLSYDGSWFGPDSS